jgi:hypothetical protein
VAIRAGDVYVPVRPDLTGFSSKLSSGVKGAATQATSGIGGFLKSSFTGIGGQMATSLLGGFAAIKLVEGVKEFISDSINAARDLVESQNKVGVVFEESAEGIRAWAMTAAESMGISEQAALESAGTFGNLFDAMGLADDAGADMSMTLVQLASDLASFNNQSPEKVLEDLQSGLTGQIRPLRKYGIEISEAAIKQEALAQGITKSTQEMTLAEKVNLRYGLILQQTGNAQGDFARTSEDLANSQRIAAAQWEDMQAEIGQALIPAVTSITQSFTDLVPIIAPLLADAFGDLASVIDVVATGLKFLAETAQGTQPRLEDLEESIVSQTSFFGPYLEAVNEARHLWGLMGQEAGRDWRPAFDNLHDAFKDGEITLEDYILGLKGIEEAYGVEIPTIQELETHLADLEVQHQAAIRDQEMLATATREGTGFVQEQATAYERATHELKQYRLEQLALLDPQFAIINAFEADEEATTELIRARRNLARLEEKGITSGKKYATAQERVSDAALGAAQSHSELLGAANALFTTLGKDATLNDARKAFSNMATAAGLSKDEARGLWQEIREAVAALRDWNSTDFADKHAVVTIEEIIARKGRAIAAQSGFHGVLSEDTLILAGEAGPERVDITPLRSRPPAAAAGIGSGGPVPIRGKLKLDMRGGMAEIIGEIDWHDWSRAG